MKIRMLDLARLHRAIRSELDVAYDKVITTSAFVGASTSSEFERTFAALHEREHGIGCGSGTDALALALRALGIGAGDEVIVPAFTFVATAEAVVHCGALPVLADVDPTSLLLTDSNVREVLSEKTRAVVPVHLYGHPCQFSNLQAWRDSNLLVIEDAAQAHFATWRGQHVGDVGHAAAFSFYPGKNLGALGDGGIILTDDADAAMAMYQLRDHGRINKYESVSVGWCSRLDGIQAAFLLAKLPFARRWTDARERRANLYSARLQVLSGIVEVPWEKGAVHHQFVVRVGAEQRDAIRLQLAKAGIETEVHYPLALSLQRSLAAQHRHCPNAERAAKEVISLPLDPLMDEMDVEYVCDHLIAAVRS